MAKKASKPVKERVKTPIKEVAPTKNPELNCPTCDGVGLTTDQTARCPQCRGTGRV